ncbi:hypothetical protein BD769DRAFT_1667697 [Suillus cothurnatus]|nr:hypothetical protein BD769DRAFT_1667697 [Suillus cothurnatus]
MSTRCFLPHCPCESTSPQNSDIIDVEPSAAINARNAEVALVYRCCWDTQHSPCGIFIEGTPRDILSHLRERHGIVHTADAELYREAHREASGYSVQMLAMWIHGS